MAKKTVIVYKDTRLGCYNDPFLIPGSTDETLEDFKEQIKRVNKLGKWPIESNGNEAYAIGIYDDSKATYTLFEEKIFLGDCRNEE